jgi:hypothetical protein
LLISYILYSEESIHLCAAPTSKNAGEMENQVYSKANSKVSQSSVGHFM